MITDGVTEAPAPRSASARSGCARRWPGVSSPALAVQQVEGALHAFTDGRLDDDAAISRSPRRPPPRDRARPPASNRELVERLFEAFNRRDAEEIVAALRRGARFFPVGTAEAVGRDRPYRGPAGLRDYLGDVDRVWEELLISADLSSATATRCWSAAASTRRGRELGIRDMPMTWIWDIAGGASSAARSSPTPSRRLLRLAGPLEA